MEIDKRTYLGKVLMVLRQPSAFFEEIKQEDYKQTLKFLAITAVVPYFLIFILALLTSFEYVIRDLLSVASYWLITYFWVIVVILVSTAILHVFAKIFGGKKGIESTLKAVVYGSTLAAYYFWIPLANFIFGIWSLCLLVVGLSKLHELSIPRSLLACVPIIILLTVILISTMTVF